MFKFKHIEVFQKKDRTMICSAIQKMFSHYHFILKVKGVSNEVNALVQMVKSNMGLLITSDQNQLHDEEIVVKEIEQSTFHCYICLPMTKQKKPSELVEKIISYAKKISIHEENH